MANTKSTEKRIRQNEKARKHNAAVKSSLRTAAKKVIKEIASAKPEESKENYRQFAKKIDTAARKGIVPKKTAARKKSRIAKKVNSAAQKSS